MNVPTPTDAPAPPPADPTRPGLRGEAMRLANLATIVRGLHLLGPTTRSDLVRRTGLTRSAVGDLVAELTDRGLVHEVPSEPTGAPGRPSPVVTPRAETNVVLGVEIMVDTVAVAAVGLGGTLLRSVRRPREHGPADVDRTLDDVAGLTSDVLDSLTTPSALFGVGVAVPGLIRRDGATVATAPNLGWADLHLVAALRPRLASDAPISVLNEADAGALAESRRGAAARRGNVLYLSGEVGVGGGIITGGHQLTGSTGFAGEVGHLPIRPDGDECRCGGRGCFETEIGEAKLLERAGLDPAAGAGAITDLLERSAAGDADAVRALEEHGRWLGFGLSGLINVLDPGVVVLGGLLRTLHPHLERPMLDTLDRHVLADIRAGTTIAPSALGDDAPLLGAAELAWDRTLADPTALPTPLPRSA